MVTERQFLIRKRAQERRVGKAHDDVVLAQRRLLAEERKLGEVYKLEIKYPRRR